MGYKRIEIGAVMKAKEEGEMDYIKIKEDVTFKKGDTLSLENRASKLASLEKNIANGKLSGDLSEKIRDQIEKTPFYDPVTRTGFIRFNIVKVTKD